MQGIITPLRSLSLVLGCATLLAGCFDLRDPLAPNEVKCEGCHGTTASAAPPKGLWITGGKSDTTDRGVGAHQTHLTAPNGITVKIACERCHIVPRSVDDPGHLDTPPADVIFSGRAIAGGFSAVWDPAAATCKVYCHSSQFGGGTNNAPKWTDVGNKQAACGSCHGLPPASPHPQSKRCSLCHAKVVDDQMKIIDLTLHINGTIDVPADLACNACHGSQENDAPPTDTSGGSDPTSRGVGAHQAHVKATALHAAYDCDVCHVKPKTADAPGHIDAKLPAEVTFSAIATGDLRRPALGLKATYDNGATTLTCSSVYCHALNGAGVPVVSWNKPQRLVCGSCHGMPPAKTAKGQVHPPSSLAGCGRCHVGVVNSSGLIADTSKHANGKLDVPDDLACNTCHGSKTNDAPPRDTTGKTAISARGVGAHQAHVRASTLQGGIACDACHITPAKLNAKGHIDSVLPAEVTFGKLSTGGLRTPTLGLKPTWNPKTQTCATTYCHDRPGGGHPPLVWNQKPPQPLVCGACHGLPPATNASGAKHPASALGGPKGCWTCHSTVDNTGRIIKPTQHLNGIVDK